jgi:drug/metabolite transporter (DMT)-like permease
MAPVIAVIVLRERIVWTTIAGVAFILAASYLNIMDKRKNAGVNGAVEKSGGL